MFRFVTLRFSKKFQIITSNYISILLLFGKWESNQPQNNEKNALQTDREISKLSLSIFSPGQFININLVLFSVLFLFFVLIYIFLHCSLAWNALRSVLLFSFLLISPLGISKSIARAIRNWNNLIRCCCWLNYYLYRTCTNSYLLLN